jgi:hypothetical protein
MVLQILRLRLGSALAPLQKTRRRKRHVLDQSLFEMNLSLVTGAHLSQKDFSPALEMTIAAGFLHKNWRDSAFIISCVSSFPSLNGEGM